MFRESYLNLNLHNDENKWCWFSKYMQHTKHRVKKILSNMWFNLSDFSNAICICDDISMCNI